MKTTGSTQQTRSVPGRAPGLLGRYRLAFPRTVATRPVAVASACTLLFLALVSVLLTDVRDTFMDPVTYTLALALTATAAIAGSWVVAFEMRDRFAAHSRTVRLAASDRLTGLLNRKALSMALYTQWKAASRTNKPMSLILIAVDGLSELNQLRGYSMGDETLIMVANCIQEALQRPADRAGRHGAAEFVMMLPDTSKEGATLIGSAIRQAVMDLDIRHEGRNLLGVNIGCATCTPVNELSPETLIAAATAQMQVARTTGRNQVMATTLNRRPFARTESV